ncbi:MAG: hypothetical protein IH812_08020 [Proteobacteria bacterium]|nr:hypothetical protein [Pseudomonadota bacterium]
MWEESVDSLLLGVDLDPASADAMSTVSGTLAVMRQWSRLEKSLLLARERFSDDTGLASIAAMLALWSRGDVESARARSTSVRPNAGGDYVTMMTGLPWFERDFAGVIKAWDLPEVVTLTSSAGWAGFRELDLAMAYQHLVETDRADRLLGEIVQRLAEIDRDRTPGQVANDLMVLAEALALQGEKASAIENAEESTRILRLENDKVAGPWPLKVLCQVLALTGERDRALELMAQLIDMPAGFIRWEMYLDPRWDFFRDDDRFNDLIRPDNLEQSIYAKESSSQ